jgi:hypothetical protein
MQLSWIGSGKGHQFGNRSHRQFRIDGKTDDVVSSDRDRREVLHRIEGHAFVKVHIGCHQRIGADHQCVAIRDGARDHGGAEIAAGARPIVDDHRLAPHRLQPLAQRAGQKIAGSARRLRHQQRHRARRVILPQRRRELAQGRQRQHAAQQAAEMRCHCCTPGVSMAGHYRTSEA